jgi:RNA polymerase sigma factor (sigma-70 family)
VRNDGVLSLPTVRAAKHGDLSAAEEVGSALLNWARQRAGRFSGTDPDDLAASFAGKLCRDRFASLPDLEGSRLEAYLYRVLRNLALNELRTARRRRWQVNFTLPVDEEDILDHRIICPESIVLERDALRQLWTATGTLSVEDRQILFAAASGASRQELAEKFRLKANTLSQRLWAARQRLQKALERTQQ